jgi:hypothetical protein
MNINRAEIIVKKAIITLTCWALVAPLAFGQTRSTHTRHRTTTTEVVTVTGTIIPIPDKGAATSYQPVKTLVIREDSSNNPGRYVLDGPGRVVNRRGEVVQTAIKPGSRVLVYYINTGESRVVDHVVVLDEGLDIAKPHGSA